MFSQDLWEISIEELIPDWYTEEDITGDIAEAAQAAIRIQNDDDLPF